MRKDPARIEAFELDLKVNSDWYQSNAQKAPPRPHSREKLKVIDDFVMKALAAEVIEPNQATSWIQVY